MSPVVTHERTYSRTIDGLEYEVTLILKGDFLGDEGPREVPTLNSVRVEYVGAPDEHLPYVTSTIMRKIPLASLVREMTRDILTERDERPHYAERIKALRNSGPTPEALRLVAEIYTDAYLSGQKIVQTVSEKMSLSKSTACRWIQKSRDMGYLTITKGTP